MRFLTALLAVPYCVAWTPPIFVDTMKEDEVARQDDEPRELQINKFSGPTASPTESPAPSPSPSQFPTGGPTVTASPTATPTSPPTESPAPSPSPSAIPTSLPSAEPSQGPTLHPTISQPPSNQPSVSFAPSVTPSAFPSGVPSMLPSLSPSSSPTFITNVHASFTVEFDFETPLAITETNAFEEGTKTFVSTVNIPGGSLQSVSCDVYNQVVMVEPDPEATDDAQTIRFLQVFFLIHAEYFGSDADFDLFTSLNPDFQNKHFNWVGELADRDPKFASLVEAKFNNGEDHDRLDRKEDGRASMSKKSYTGILLVSFVALLLAVIASIYAVRSHNFNMFGTELRSPMSKQGSVKSLFPKTQGSRLQPDMEPKLTESVSSDVEMPVDYRQIYNPVHRSMPVPPPPVPPPPHLASAAKKERDPIAHRASELPEPPAFSEVNFGRDSSLFDRQSLTSQVSSEATVNKAQGRISDTMAERIAMFEKVSDVSDAGHELLLTKSFGGTLGAKAVSNSSAGTSSDISSQAKMFFDNLVHNASEQLKGTSTQSKSIQKPNGQSQTSRAPTRLQSQARQRRMSYESVLRKPGLYDVFAPPGPVGIVVDTSSKGPAVHSLKNSSPMIGLIAPGDLIVGLDDEDTRKMNAATLTRLMAQKANQKERKITLLTSET